MLLWISENLNGLCWEIAEIYWKPSSLMLPTCAVQCRGASRRGWCTPPFATPRLYTPASLTGGWRSWHHHRRAWWCNGSLVPLNATTAALPHWLPCRRMTHDSSGCTQVHESRTKPWMHQCPCPRTARTSANPVTTSTTQSMPYWDLCPRVIHDPSKLTVRSMVSSMPIYGSRSWYTRRTTRSASSNRRVTTILLASQMARECRANVLWWTGAMSRKRHSFTSPECPTPMSIDPAMACRTVKKGTLPEVDPSIRSE